FLCTGATGSYVASGGSIGSFFKYTIHPSNIGPFTKQAGVPLMYTFENAGTYEICVTEIEANLCVLTDPNCMTVVVEDIPVGQESATICIPGPGYVASNGEEFFSPGVYTLEFE